MCFTRILPPQFPQVFGSLLHVDVLFVGQIRLLSWQIRLFVGQIRLLSWQIRLFVGQFRLFSYLTLSLVMPMILFPSILTSVVVAFRIKTSQIDSSIGTKLLSYKYFLPLETTPLRIMRSSQELHPYDKPQPWHTRQHTRFLQHCDTLAELFPLSSRSSSAIIGSLMPLLLMRVFVVTCTRCESPSMAIHITYLLVK